MTDGELEVELRRLALALRLARDGGYRQHGPTMLDVAARLAQLADRLAYGTKEIST